MTVETRKLKALPIYMGTSGCDYHRIKLPFLYSWEWLDDDNYKGFSNERLIEFMAKSELIVYNRNFPIGLDRIKKLKEEYGFKIVVDLDDWFVLPDYHPNYRDYKERAAKMIIDNLRHADCVTVTTDRLYQRIKQYNINCHVIPNALPYGHNQFTEQPAREENEKMNFIYTGQSSHLEDVRIMQAGVNRASRMKDVKFSLAGYKGHKVWHGIEQVFDRNESYTRIESKPLHEYMQVYDHADCSVVPLCLNDFNAHKSNLKLLEAGAKKIPAIVSWVPPYRDDVDAPVLWVKHPDDWYKHIKYLAENRDYAKEMGEKLHEWAKEKFHLAKWNRVRFELYQTLIS